MRRVAIRTWTKGIVLVYCANNEMHMEFRSGFFVDEADKETRTMDTVQGDSLWADGEQDTHGNKGNREAQGFLETSWRTFLQ